MSSNNLQISLRQLDIKLKKVRDDKLFRELESKINSQFRIEYDSRKYPGFFDYVSSLFLVDMLNVAFTEKEINLPPYLTALDFGTGEWGYVHSLYNFLKYYREERRVHLTGINIKREWYDRRVRKSIEDIDAAYIPNVDGVELCENDAYKNAYNIVLMAHIFSTESHSEDHGIKYCPPSEIFQKGLELLHESGLFIGISYTHIQEELEGLDKFPKNKVIYDTKHSVDLGEMTDLLRRYSNIFHGFNDNRLILGTKQEIIK